MDSALLDESYACCHALMRSAARNFYYGMRLLPEAKRRGMYALYSFMRIIDDIADDPAGGSVEDRRGRLEECRGLMHEAVAGRSTGAGHPVLPALGDTVRRFSIPVRLLDEAIDGQLQDLSQTIYTTFGELYRYCYRVASTVGIAAVHIWGFADPRAIQLAEERGIAMQLTNILRDLSEDAARGRQYLPTEDYARFDLMPGDEPGRMKELITFEAGRAAGFYESSQALESMIAPDSRPTLEVMTSIYRGILNRIAAHPHLVFIRRVGLRGYEKVLLVLRQTWRSQMAAIEGP